jgi:predicted lactoylglutathione lyase
MGLELYMIGLIVEDMARSLAFYERLGVDIPEGSEGKSHVQIKMGSGLTFFLDSAPDRWDPRFAKNAELNQGQASAGYPFVLEFYLKERATLDQKYQDLIGFGYQGHRDPYETQFGMYFAMIKDPDGNVILLSAD